ncbi:protein IQ-DOMAIN 5-like [Phragmites australis]|uniref:protein IQ-DOMAIN 5-like n=1 Tax=Phragmites australis TaxID=29695 RepID=UPI002D78B1A7|nr:protein IQ-DOMAIN 5-like [Phragmites australis]
MGISARWLKSLVGLRKVEKQQHRKEGADVGRTGELHKPDAIDQFHCQNQHSKDDDNLVAQEEFTNESGPPEGDSDMPSCLEPTCSSLHVPLPQTEEELEEILAATVIQTAFRAFLARRARRALKGLVRLQALVRGHIVRKQAAITLHCMQALVRVQARVRARRVRLALENETDHQNTLQEEINETQAHVREIEDGWCDSIGSVEDIQAKLLKRQEAAAKRERAMAYALTHQWQAGSRQHAATTAFEPDNNSWGWKWLERWMAVRPWESRFLGTYAADGIAVGSEARQAERHLAKTPCRKPVKKRTSTLHSNAVNQKACPSNWSSGSVSAKSRLKLLPREGDEASSRPSGLGVRSTSNPKERTGDLDCQELRLPSLSSTTSSRPRNLTRFRAMAATSSRRLSLAALVAMASAVLLASVAAGNDGNGVYDPCADASVQRGDGVTFGVAFAGHDAFFSGGVQLSPCDSRLGLANRAQLALFRPKVDEISLLTVNASSSSSGAAFDPASSGGYMVAFAGRKYAARSSPVFVSNISYTVTGFTLVFEFQKGTLQNLFWKADGCSTCSGKSDFACVDQSCAIKTTSCKGKGGQVNCSPGIQLAFSGTDKHEAVLNSWYEVSKLRQYSLFGLFSDLKNSLTSQFSSFF